MTDPFNKRIGTRRLFKNTNHRLNKDAFERIITDLLETIVIQNAAIYGTNDTAAGVLGTWDVTYDEGAGAGVDDTISFPNPGYLVYGTMDTSGLAVAKVGRYYPNTSAQGPVTPVDVSILGGTDQGFIWFRVTGAEVDLDSEAYWTTTEVDTPPVHTLEMERVDFAVTSTAAHVTYNEDNGWFRLARIASWAGGAPDIRFIHFTDAKGIIASGGAYIRSHTAFTDDPTTGIPSSPNNGGGIVETLKDVVHLLYMFGDADWNIDVDGTVSAAGRAGWYHRPTYGHKQIDTQITNLLAQVANLNQAINNLMLSAPLYTGSLSNGNTYLQSSPIGAAPTVDLLYATGRTRLSFDPAGVIKRGDVSVVVTAENVTEAAIANYEWEVGSDTELIINTYDDSTNHSHATRNFSVAIFACNTGLTIDDV